MRHIRLRVLFTASLLVAIFGWNAAKNTPRDGWSWVKMQIGAAPMPGSGDRAYFVAGFGPFSRLDQNNPTPESFAMTLVRRDRRGLFIPWLETNDIRMAMASGKKGDWKTGSEDPRWHGVLRSSRKWYANQDSDWHQKVVAGIDTELAGGFPIRKIRPWYLALDALVFLAHAVLLGFILYPVHLSLKAHFRSKHEPQMPLNPSSASFE